MFIACKQNPCCGTCLNWKGVRIEDDGFFFAMEYASGKCPAREMQAPTLPGENCPEWVGRNHHRHVRAAQPRYALLR